MIPSPEFLTIPLSRGLVTVVDAKDFWWLTDRSWVVARRRDTRYASRRTTRRGKNITILMHRAILDAPHGVWVDHINGDPLDNRRVNLRLTTRSQNMQNRRGPNRNNSLGFRGVTRHGDGYKASVMVRGKRFHLGVFQGLEQAAEAAKDGRRRYMTHA